jgi:heat shock protein HslJ
MRAKLIWGLLAVASAVAGCGAGGSAAGGQIWGRTFLSSTVTHRDEIRPLVAGTRIRLRFDDGAVQADAGCNHLAGRASQEGGQLAVSDLGGTAMGCDAALTRQDAWLAGFLSGRPSWRLDGDTLVLRAGDTEIVLVDSRVAEPDRALIGTRWSIESVIDGQAASSVPAGTNARLTFQVGDRVTGWTGCNTFSGTATRPSDDTIVFSRIVSSRRACPTEAGRHTESAVLAVLAGRVQVTIQGDRLTLTHPNGQGLSLRAGK